MPHPPPFGETILRWPHDNEALILRDWFRAVVGDRRTESWGRGVGATHQTPTAFPRQRPGTFSLRGDRGECLRSEHKVTWG